MYYLICIHFLPNRVAIFSFKYLCLSIHVKIHIGNLSSRDRKNMFLKFCTSDRFITKDFFLMNSNIEHIYCYAQKYHHFLVKFEYSNIPKFQDRDLPKVRIMQIVFWQERKLYVRQKKLKSLFGKFSLVYFIKIL